MTLQEDIKKNWPKAKKQLKVISKEAMVVAEKGKNELMRLSKESKLRLDLTSLELKKEHLYFLIGREFVNENYPKEPGEKLKKFIEEIKNVVKEQDQLKDTLEKKTKARE